ncbi:uncharacterized protein LOC134779089 [Penaeus indicus]|uniref:uncharacterized protein LOC134779089 n=1 Tax=Penaeus indicus TaxID=29960 RepID=UPI00300DA439
MPLAEALRGGRALVPVGGAAEGREAQRGRSLVPVGGVAGTRGGRGQRHQRQPQGFLKTVSIIDTLSELAHGPEATRLAQEEPRPTLGLAPNPPSSSSSSSSSSSNHPGPLPPHHHPPLPPPSAHLPPSSSSRGAGPGAAPQPAPTAEFRGAAGQAVAHDSTAGFGPAVSQMVPSYCPAGASFGPIVSTAVLSHSPAGAGFGPAVGQALSSHASTNLTSTQQAAAGDPAPAPGSQAAPTPAAAATNPLLPPVLSPDFRQYSEKIYDAVTSSSSGAAGVRRCVGSLGGAGGPLRMIPERGAGRGKERTTGERKRGTGRADERGTGTGGEERRGRERPGGGGRGTERGKRIETERAAGKARPSAREGGSRRPSEREHGGAGRERGTERGRTPDWIKRIFDVAKNGELHSLKRSVANMEGSLIRNLSDHSGNNLLHVMAVYGHLQPLTWLLSTHEVLLDALHDENKFGLTPLVCAIKYGNLRLLQWLVENSRVREKVRPRDGERSLLHVAAKYAQEEIVLWLARYMSLREIPLDSKDHLGNTALHLAARTGNCGVCSILLQHGADVTLKNDLCHKAWETSASRGHVSCAEFLCVQEAGLALAADVTRREAELDAAAADNHAFRTSFKEAVSIARRLAKDREEEAVSIARRLAKDREEGLRELAGLRDCMADAHERVLQALQALADENARLRERVDGVRGQREARFLGAQKVWFGTMVDVDLRHRMGEVEGSWKRLRAKNHRTVATAHLPLDVFSPSRPSSRLAKRR